MNKISNLTEFTELQWLKKGYILKDNVKGKLGWNNCYYTYKVLRYRLDQVVYNEEKAKAILKEMRHKQYLVRKAEKVRQEKHQKLVGKMREEWHTEFQWKIEYNRKVKEGARGRYGEDLNRAYNCICFGSKAYYYHYNDTIKIEV